MSEAADTREDIDGRWEHRAHLPITGVAARLHGTKTRAVGPPSIRGQDAMVRLNECCRTNSKSKRNEETDGAALKAPRRNGAKIEQCQTGRRVGTIAHNSPTEPRRSN